MLKGLRGTFKRRDKGFTLIELLIVIAILGIISSVVALSVVPFIGTGKVEAANIEASTVRTAIAAYIVENDGTIPGDTSVISDYLQGSLKGSYTIMDGIIEGDDDSWPGLDWDEGIGEWIKE